MNKIRIGIICPSEIAYRRFLPALSLCDDFEYAGVAVACAEEWGGEYSAETRNAEMLKAQNFVNDFGGIIYESYRAMINSKDVDAIYLPLPPGLHYKWGREVLLANKHLFLEKPSTTNCEDTRDLVSIAKERTLAIHENYMFKFHSQIQYILKCIKDDWIGDLRLFRIAFGFPRRTVNDFRYNKALGGGALLDAGGYTIKLATMLLGNTAKIVSSRLNYIDEFEVDIFGSVTMENNDGLTAQLSFGMDNCYKCDLEVWGSKGSIFANRILTAPSGYEPVIEYKNGNNPVEQIKLPADDTFFKSILHFQKCVKNEKDRYENYEEIIKQADLVELVKGV